MPDIDIDFIFGFYNLQCRALTPVDTVWLMFFLHSSFTLSAELVFYIFYILYFCL
jgi:hypothetical protein